MKKILSIFAIFACAVMPTLSQGAITVKKAAAVKVEKTSAVESATSLIPSVLGLVNNVKSLKSQQQQLEADCAPTNDELNTVNNLIKEWAKIGDTDAEYATSGLGNSPCSSDESKNYLDSAYRDFMEIEYSEKGQSCYLQFTSSSDSGMIWYGFPKASSAKICPAGDNKNCKTVSNIYDLLVKIPFSEEDFTKKELDKITRLIEKSERCAPAKITAAKRQMWGGFLTQTLNSVGAKSGAAGTSSIIEAVSSMGGSGNIQSMLPSLGQMALQTFEK